MTVVSVIIPTYNNSQVIGRAVSSAVRQTLRDIQIIVVDDGSTDNTQEIVSNLSDSRIGYIRLAENRGSGAARNRGLQIAKGRYIAFLDSDDEWHPSKLERQVRLMESLPDEWGACQVGGMIIKDGFRQAEFRPRRDLAADAFRNLALGKLTFLTSGIMVRSSCLESIGVFDESLRRGQDIDFLLRLFMVYKLAVIEIPLITFHQQTDKKLGDSVEHARLRILAKHEETIRRLLGERVARQFRSVHLLDIADAEFRSGQATKGVKYLISALSYHPVVSPGRLLRLLLSAMGLLANVKSLLRRMARPVC